MLALVQTDLSPPVKSMEPLKAKIMERLKIVMFGLWYPAVLGTLIVLFLDRWREDLSHFTSEPAGWLGLFLIVYYSISFQESQFNENYDFVAWGVDLFDVFLVYLAYVFLGYGLKDHTCNPQGFWIVALVTCFEPIAWRWIFRDLDDTLDRVCIAGMIITGFEISRATFDWLAVFVIGSLVAIYLLLVYLRLWKKGRSQDGPRALSTQISTFVRGLIFGAADPNNAPFGRAMANESHRMNEARPQ
jgi:hypothetical protein